MNENMKETFPLIEISPKHFQDRYLINCINIFSRNANNYDTYTGQLTKSMRDQKGEIYRDIHVDHQQLVAWLAANEPRSRSSTLGADRQWLQIAVGNDELFDHLEVNNYGVHRTISLAAKNNGSKKIANCNFYRTYISIFDDNNKVLLDGPFSLDPKELRYIPIATFNETKDLPDATHLIGLSMPPAAFGAGIMQPRLAPDRRYTVTFLATSTDCKDAVLYCEIFVDGAGKLRCSKV
jgi:hypothetical protein